MYINKKFFGKAIETARKNHGYYPNTKVAESLLEIALRLREDAYKFNREMIRLALNEANLWESDRRLYSSFLHSYFSQRPRMRHRITKMQPVPTGSLPYKVEEELKSHQFRWII